MTEDIRPTESQPRAEEIDPRQSEALAEVRAALRGLRYGHISIIVQDGVVIQIERTERTRLRRPEK